MEALDRQEELESSQTSRHSLEESSGGLRRGRSYEPEEEHNSKEEVKQVEEEEEEELVEEKPQRSYLREQVCISFPFMVW